MRQIAVAVCGLFAAGTPIGRDQKALKPWSAARTMKRWGALPT